MAIKPSDYRRFKLSKPWGYYPPDVDAALDRYDDTLGKLNQSLAEQMQANLRLQKRIGDLELELRKMHMEMASLELPDVDEITQQVVLNEFKDWPGGAAHQVENPEPSEGKLPVEGKLGTVEGGQGDAALERTVKGCDPTLLELEEVEAGDAAKDPRLPSEGSAVKSGPTRLIKLARKGNITSLKRDNFDIVG